jgi:hypothetical protein
LFWIDYLAPTHRPRSLLGMTAVSGAWNSVAVRTQDARDEAGFFHFRIDEAGQLYQSNHWKSGFQHPASEGVIHVVVSVSDPAAPINASQNSVLAQVITQLCRDHRIPQERVQVIPLARLAASDSSLVSMR